MFIRTLTAILLSALLTTTASSQTKDSSKDKESPKWPDKIEGKGLPDWLKTATSDLDPANREHALLTIANFDPVEIRKVCAKTLIARMTGGREQDAGVRLVLISFVPAMGLEDLADIKEATRVLAASANGGNGYLRFTAIQALGKFGPKAHAHIPELTSTVLLEDSSYIIRQALAHTLGRIGHNETSGPSAQAIKVLSGALAHDKSAVVQVEALESLFILGPPWDLKKPVVKGMPPPIDEEAAQVTINAMKARVGGKKAATATETDKQIELWCRLVIIKFGVTTDLDEQLKGIAAHLSDPEASVKIQALGILSAVGEYAAPQMGVVAKLLDEKDELGNNSADYRIKQYNKQRVRAAALHTLGTIGIKAIDPILKTIENPKEIPDIRIAALDALALLGEKAEGGREILKTIITDSANLKGDGVTLLTHALTTLASMGEKAQSSVPVLEDLMRRLDKAKEDRLNSPEYKKFKDSPEIKIMLEKLPPDERKKVYEKIFENPEDQFKKGVEETIRFIKESTPGHPGPGGDQKKP